jgi:prepilin-type N-terminal cleavage/methylation domain-containing protein
MNDGRSRASGFTLVEVLVALGILAIVMTVLYGTFSTSSVTARVVEERADELSSLTGALDTLTH